MDAFDGRTGIFSAEGLIAVELPSVVKEWEGWEELVSRLVSCEICLLE